MSVPSDRERLVRLETRAKEADVALRQLKNYIQLLKQKAGFYYLFQNKEHNLFIFYNPYIQVVLRQLLRRYIIHS